MHHPERCSFAFLIRITAVRCEKHWWKGFLLKEAEKAALVFRAGCGAFIFVLKALTIVSRFTVVFGVAAAHLRPQNRLS